MTELRSDLGVPPTKNGNLERWSKQGVFLLNTCLTVRKGEANSHQGKGWETFTDATIKLLAAGDRRLVFLLWGKPAQVPESHTIPYLLTDYAYAEDRPR
jgi:uracil-DNA glycosylase